MSYVKSALTSRAEMIRRAEFAINREISGITDPYLRILRQEEATRELARLRRA